MGVLNLWVAYNFSEEAWVFQDVRRHGADARLRARQGFYLSRHMEGKQRCSTPRSERTLPGAARDAPRSAPATCRPPEALRDDGRLLLAGPMPAIDSPTRPGGLRQQPDRRRVRLARQRRAWLDDFVRQGVFVRTHRAPVPEDAAVSATRVERIRAALQERFAPTRLEIGDDSALPGAEGAREEADIIGFSSSPEAFQGCSRVVRQRMI